MKKIYAFVIAAICLISLSQIAISALPTIRVNETDLVNIQLLAVDIDKDPLSYSYSSPLNSTGQWQTKYGDNGEYIVNVSASDGRLKTTQKFLLVVEKVNWPPEVKDLKDIEIDEGDAVQLKIQAKDEENDPLKIEISEPFSKSNTWQTDFTDAGTYPVEVSVSDGTHTIFKKFTIKVKNINRKPEIESSSPSSAKLSMKEGESMTFLVNAVDADKDLINYTWYVDCKEQSIEPEKVCRNQQQQDKDYCATEQPQAVQICEEKPRPAKEFKYYADYDAAGEHEIKVKVQDSEEAVVKKWIVKVENTNRPPVLKDFENIVVNEGDLVKVKIGAEDPDGDLILYTVPEPVGEDKEWQTAYEDSGEYILQVKVSDGKLSATKPVKIIIKDVDRAPEFNKIPDITINETDKVIIKVNAKDADADKVTYSATGLPENAFFEGGSLVYQSSFDTVTKPKKWYVEVLKFLRLDHKFYNEKTYVINVSAKGKEKASSQVVSLTVKNKNRAPLLMPMNDIVVNETEKIKLYPKAVEYDNDRVEFYFSEPVKNGEWQTGYNSSGKYTVKVTAFDGKEYVNEYINITVNNKNRAPTLKSIRDVMVKENETAVIKPQISDLDWEPVELAVVKAPSKSELVNNTFKWTPDFDATVEGKDKDFLVTLSLTDINKAAAYTDTKITVTNVNRAPIIYNVSPSYYFKAYTGDTVMFIPYAMDPDKDNLTYEWKDGSNVISNKQKITRTFTVPGKKELSVRVSDGKATKRYTWRFEIAKGAATQVIQPVQQQQFVVEKVVEKPAVQTQVQTVYVDRPVAVEQPQARTLVYTIEDNANSAQKPTAQPDGTVDTSLVEVYYYTEPTPVPDHMKQYNIG